MKSAKILVLFLIASLYAVAQPQLNYVQQMGYRDYGVSGSMNIGSGKLKATAPSAYLELGDSAYSRKGLLFPRGNKDSVLNPVRGLVVFDIVSGTLQQYTGTAWVPLGSGAGIPGGAVEPKKNTQTFAGSSANQWTLAKTPLAGSIVLYINGQRQPAGYYTVSVNTVLLNSSMASYATDTLDVIEIFYLSNN